MPIVRAAFAAVFWTVSCILWVVTWPMARVHSWIADLVGFD